MARGLIPNLIRRRVPQIFGIYLGACWVAVEFSDWLVGRYLLSDHLVDLALIGLLSFSPAVLMMAYFHGAPGKDKWEQVEKIGVPANLLVTIALLVATFHGKELGATVTTVTVTDELGTVLQKVLPKQSFRRHIAVFFFDYYGDDQKFDLLQYGFTVLLAADLEQDPFMEVWTPYSGFEQGGFLRLRRAGFADGLKAPLPLLREIAAEGGLEYFLAGSFAQQGEQLKLTASLYRTDTARLVANFELLGADPLALVDELSVQVKDGMEVPAGGLELASDLPVADRLSHSLPALRDFVAARNTIVFDNDYDRAIELWEAAVDEDSAFAVAHLVLSEAYFERGKLEAARSAIGKALQHDYRLLEREKFIARGNKYAATGEVTKRTALFEMWTELYPEDTRAHRYLARTYLYHENRPDDALASMLKIIELDPSQEWVLRAVAEIYEVKGEAHDALRYYQRYVTVRPDDDRPLVAMANLYRRSGELDKARKYFERASLLASGRVDPLLGLVDLDVREGDFVAAQSHLREAQSIASVPQEHAAIIRARMNLHEQRGQMQKVVELLQQAYELRSQYQTPRDLLMSTYLTNADLYVSAGRTAEGMSKLAQAESMIEPPLDEIVQVGYMLMELEKGNADGAEVHTDRVAALIGKFKRDDLLYKLDWARSDIRALRGDLRSAVEALEKALAQFSISVQSLDSEEDRVPMLISLGSYYRELGELDAAASRLNQALQFFPAHPGANLEMARLLQARGAPDEALEHLNRALDVWQAADSEYRRALEARALLAELETGTPKT